MSTDYTLAYGTHATPEDGRCAMEWVCYLASEPHSDEPPCVSPALRAFCIALNDGLDHAPRQRLRPYLARTIGTADDGLDETRSWVAMDWLIRVYAPAWLALAGLTDAAARLAALPPVEAVADLHPALSALERARRQARSAWTEALCVKRISWAAGRAAAREAAWGSAGAAAWAAARLGIGDIVGDRARAAARSAAGDAAAAAARQARTVTERAAAKEATRSVLAPTLDALNDSALMLLDRMLPKQALSIDGPLERAGRPAALLSVGVSDHR
jgi:hypothetical protein